MNREEAKQLVMIITYTYPNFKPLDLTTMVDIWATMLADYDYKSCELALKSYITTDTKGFAPSVGQVIAKLDSIKNSSNDLNEMEAWALVSRAIRNGTYHSKEEFAKLPESVQKAVGSSSQLEQWARTSENSIENVVQSNFIKTYRNVLNRSQEYRRLPTEAKALIGNSEKLLIEG